MLQKWEQGPTCGSNEEEKKIKIVKLLIIYTVK
jgi:hypothetical protein